MLTGGGMCGKTPLQRADEPPATRATAEERKQGPGEDFGIGLDRCEAGTPYLEKNQSKRAPVRAFKVAFS